MNDQINARRRRRRAENRDYVNRLKTERGCERCGYNDHPSALDLHHTDPAAKTARNENGRAYGLEWSRARIDAEFAKCEVVCANCHRIEHHAAVVIEAAHVLGTDEGQDHSLTAAPGVS